jgi:hypothetical protein
MSIWIKIGKHSLVAGCILILWAFLCILPLRSLALSKAFPSFFQVPFSSNSKWIFIVIGLSPLTILGVPLYFFHRKYTKWDGEETNKRIFNKLEEYKAKGNK